MNTNCSVEAIRLFSLAIVAVALTGSKRKKKQLALDWINPCIVDQGLPEFRARMGLMLKAEVGEHLSLFEGVVPKWNDFDLQRSIAFPEIFKDKVYQYGGAGQIFTYDMFQVKSYLNALKSKELGDYVKTIDKYNFTGSFSVDDCHTVKIEYPNGFVLEMVKENRGVRWYRSGELVREMQFRENESPKGLLTALEDYSANGVVDEAYGMFMIVPFDLDMDHVSFNQRGRLFIQDLAI